MRCRSPPAHQWTRWSQAVNSLILQRSFRKAKAWYRCSMPTWYPRTRTSAHRVLITRRVSTTWTPPFTRTHYRGYRVSLACSTRWACPSSEPLARKKRLSSSSLTRKSPNTCRPSRTESLRHRPTAVFSLKRSKRPPGAFIPRRRQSPKCSAL